MRTLIKRSDFADPTLVEVPTYDELFKRKLDTFKELAPDYAYFLASDPVVKVLRAFALQELFLYALANDRALATLLTHATGEDLNSIGVFYGVVRLTVVEPDPDANPPVVAVYEEDERFRARIADSIIAFSAAGPAEHYRFHAMSADPRVKDAVVYSPDLPNFLNMGGRVAVAVLSSEDNGVPTLDLLQAVRTCVQSKSVKVVSDMVSVEPATIRPLDIVADLVLERNAQPDIILQLEAKLRADFAKAQRLGWDAPRSWFVKTLSAEGVYEVVLVNPSSALTIRPNQFPSLNSVNIRFAGLAAEDDWQNDEVAKARLLREVHETYISYAVAAKRTRFQIQDDLVLEMAPGIVRASMVGIAEYLGLTNIRENGSLRSVEEIGIIVHYTLSKYYERGYYSQQ